MTRAVEVAPGVFVAPEDYAGPVQMVTNSDHVPGMATIILASGFMSHAAATPAEVAAKLWPGEGAEPGPIERLHGVELHMLREVFHADKASTNSELWHAVREHLGEE